VEEVKKLCVSLRRNAKDERVLFHYNGHGVPKPTSNGEIWVFNKNYTQYIPLSIYELQTWMGSPSIYVFDCSAAGLIIQWFNHFAEQRVKERDQGSSQGVVVKDYILLAACAADQVPRFAASTCRVGIQSTKHDTTRHDQRHDTTHDA
jgi:regulator-associated protein of mTOR